MFDYKLIEALASVIHEGGFEKGARKLHLTQSAISQRVKQLEDIHGAILVQRSTPPRPTEAGAELIAHYNRVAQLENELIHSPQEHEDLFSSFAIGINADSLATWFTGAIAPLLSQLHITVDLHVADQEMTHQLLQQGKVFSCITTRQSAQQGCTSHELGTMMYKAYATPAFVSRWFPDGFTMQPCRKAPTVRYNRDDNLNSRMYRKVLHNDLTGMPVNFVPSSEKYAEFVTQGMCYGILPVLQAAAHVKRGGIVDLCPDHQVDVQLYYHSWNLTTKKMTRFNRDFIANARDILSD